MNLLFLADPWDTLDHARDSTLHLASLASKDLGFRCFWTTPSEVFLLNGVLVAKATELTTDATSFKTSSLESGARPLADFHSIHWRVDPPVDLATYQLWNLLLNARAAKIFNPPQALLTWNEKLSSHRFFEHAIPSLVSSQSGTLERFVKKTLEAGKKLVLKPVGEAASRGVTLFSPPWSPQTEKTVAGLLVKHGPWLVAQEFDSTLLEKGETRAFVVGGEIVASLNKRPAPGQAIMSLDAAEKPSLQVTTLEPQQAKIAEKIAQAMLQDGIQLATIDFIGNRILEINITSAGLLKWMDENGHSIGKKYWQAVLAQIKR